MSVIFNIGKFLRSVIPTCQSNFVRYLSASQFKLSENDVEEIQIPVPWGHIAGKWWGDKKVPPVLAIHGWQDNANSFDTLIPLLNIPSVLAIDLPGHGLSSHLLEGKAYDFSEHIILLHRIKKHFNWEQMPLLTHSLGAAIAYGYAAMFPDNVKWIINFECSRSIFTQFRNNISCAMSTGIDKCLKIEKAKKAGPPAAYKLSKMIEMSIEKSLGSIASPEAALVLLKRGILVADESAVKTDEVPEDFGDFIKHEKQAVMTLPNEEREYILQVFSQLTESVIKAKETLKTSPLAPTDDKYYVYRRDPTTDVLIFYSFEEEFITEASKSITCPVLSLRAKQGFLFGSTKKLYEKTVDILKTNSKYLEHHDVDGTHHAHLNNPELLAPIINTFIQKCENLKGRWWGPRDRRPILCVHGWQDNANSFNTLIPLLPAEFSYLAIDLPGHGLSSHYPKGFFYKTYESVAALRRVQRHFNWDQVTLMGHSFGAICSFLFSSLFSKSVDTFIALDCMKPSSKNSQKDIKQAQKRVEKLLQYETFDPASAPSYTMDQLLKVWIKGTDNSVTEESCKLLIQRGAIENNGLYKIRRDLRVKQNFSINFTHTENLKLAEAVTCNILFLKATNAPYFEEKQFVLDVLEVLKTKAKYFEEHMVEGTHHIHMNNPEIVAPIIISFLQTVGGHQ